MYYTRVMLENNAEILQYLDNHKFKKMSDFSFYDLIYQNNNGDSITNDTLKIRVYSHNEWKNKSVLVIHKKAIFDGREKEDKVLMREEFDDLDSALRFFEKNFSNQYTFSFKLEKTGVQYENEFATIWLEEIVDLGTSIEIGSNTPDVINQIINDIHIKERLDVSVPEYLYQKLNSKKL